MTEYLTLRLPIPPANEQIAVAVRVPYPMTSAQWDQALAVLDTMRPGIVVDKPPLRTITEVLPDGVVLRVVFANDGSIGSATAGDEAIAVDDPRALGVVERWAD